MKINVDQIAESLLWEKVSNYVEQIKELTSMIGKISYIDTDVLASINWCEVLDSEEFIVIGVERVGKCIQVEFDMPFILSCWRDKKQLLRVTACISGTCEIPDETTYDYSSINFSVLNRKELLELGHIVKISNIKYYDVEVDICL